MNAMNAMNAMNTMTNDHNTPARKAAAKRTKQDRAKRRNMLVIAGVVMIALSFGALFFMDIGLLRLIAFLVPMIAACACFVSAAAGRNMNKRKRA